MIPARQSRWCRHRWAAPHEVVGGMEESPGIFGLDGDRLLIVEVCRRCGMLRKTYDAPDGRSRHGRAVSRVYVPPTPATRAWVRAQEEGVS